MKILKRLILFVWSLLLFFFLSIAVCKRWQRGETGIQGQISGHIICIQTKILGLPQGQLNLIIFIFTAQDGSQPRESSIVYRDDVCLSDVKNHLTTLGYRVSDHDGLSEKWIKKDEVIPYFYISIDKYTHTVTLSKVSLR